MQNVYLHQLFMYNCSLHVLMGNFENGDFQGEDQIGFHSREYVLVMMTPLQVRDHSLRTDPCRLYHAVNHVYL